ncbi:MAG: metal ABC transporter ATP-binding protein [Fimbriimonadaceae bacterium]
MNAIDVQRLTVASEVGTALDSVTLQVPIGAYVAIVGPNGSGKTTLLRCIAGLLRPTSGEVRVFGKDPATDPPRCIGYVPQRKGLDLRFPALAIELVASGKIRRWPTRCTGGLREAALAALRTVGAEHLAWRSLSALSGGEVQRVYLARALIRDARILLLDEPSTGVDPQGEETMLRVLDAVHREQGTTILAVTHDLDLAIHHAESCLVLNRRVEFFGPSSDESLLEALGRSFGHGRHDHRGS